MFTEHVVTNTMTTLHFQTMIQEYGIYRPKMHLNQSVCSHYKGHFYLVNSKKVNGIGLPINACASILYMHMYFFFFTGFIVNQH